MRKIFLLIHIIALVILTGCSNSSDNQNPPVDGVELEFAFDFGENPQTKADMGACATTSELIEYAVAGTLKANITIKGPGQGVDGTTHTIDIAHLGNGKFMSLAMILAPGTYEITQATVMNGTNLLFSAVGAGSAYEEYVSHTLPQYFNIGTPDTPNGYQTIGLYEKGTVDLELLCVMDENAEDFGFVKWDFHFTKIICLQYAVNMPDIYGEDFVAKGTLQVQNGVYDETNQSFTPASSGVIVSDISYFPKSNGLGELCFVSESSDMTTNNWYRFALYSTFPEVKTYVAYVKATDLFNYKDASNPSWNQEFNFLHIDFANNSSWIFTNEISTDIMSTEIVDISTATTIDMITPFVMTKLSASDEYQDGFIGVTLSDGRIDIPAGYYLRFKRPFKFHKSQNQHTYFEVDFDAQGSAISAPVTTANIWPMNFTGVPLVAPSTTPVSATDLLTYLCSYPSYNFLEDHFIFSFEVIFNHALSNVWRIELDINDCPEHDQK